MAAEHGAKGDVVKVSYCTLTMDCRSTVHAISQDLLNAGYPIAQWVAVDQGSRDGTMAWLEEKRLASDKVRVVVCSENAGIAKGTNLGWHAATGDWIVSANHSCICPPGWLKAMVDVAQTGEVDVVCIYDEPYPGEQSRWLDYDPLAVEPCHAPEIKEIGGQAVYASMPFARCFFRKSLLNEVGWMDERITLYGPTDVMWGRTCRHHKVRSVVLKDFIKTRLPMPAKTIRVQGLDIDYRWWRDHTAASPVNHALLKQAEEKGFPPYFPEWTK